MKEGFAARVMFGVVLTSFFVEALAATATIPPVPSKIDACSAARRICVTVAAEPIDKASTKKGYRWGGEDIEPPQSVVSEVTVVVKGEDVFVPLSAYADLGNPRTIEVRTTSRGFDVVVTGGDASAAYRALLIFEGQLLMRRKVQNSEFPKESWEQTRYKFNTLKN